MRSGNDEEVNNQQKPLFRGPAGMERQPHYQHAQHCRKQQRMGQAARRLVLERYTWRHYHERIQNAYVAILQGGDPVTAAQVLAPGAANR